MFKKDWESANYLLLHCEFVGKFRILFLYVVWHFGVPWVMLGSIRALLKVWKGVRATMSSKKCCKMVPHCLR